MQENQKDQWTPTDAPGQDRNPGTEQQHGYQNNDVQNTSTNLEEKEDERDIYRKEEVDLPQPERSSTAPYTDHSIEHDKDQDQLKDKNFDSDNNNNATTKGNNCC